MKVAILCESAADEVGLRVLIEGLLGAKVKFTDDHFRTRGWPGLRHVLPAAFKKLYYNSNADALAIVADSDDSVIPGADHQPPCGHSACRHCLLTADIARVRKELQPRPIGPSLKVAVGIAVPAIEAWLACNRPDISEAHYARKLAERGSLFDERLQLKRAVYGSDRASESRRLEGARDAAVRCIGVLDHLQKLFPGGFGTFAAAVRSWRQ